MAELNVQLRPTRGKLNARRLRRSGTIPGILYGHGKESVALAVPSEEFGAMLRHGTRLVNLVGEIKEQAFVREVQWNTWGTHILHVDFTRISEHEKVEVNVAVELRGEAPGVKEGGVLEQHLHELAIECEVSAIPEKISVRVGQLKLGDSIAVKDLEMPPTARALDDPEAIVVACVQPTEEAEEEAAGEGAEPELIGRKPAEEEEAE